MRNHDRGYPTRRIEESSLPSACEERLLRLADKAFQRVPQRESGAAKHCDQFLCGMNWDFGRRQKSSSLSPDYRIVIVFHSPRATDEPGLPICPTEKTAPKGR